MIQKKLKTTLSAKTQNVSLAPATEEVRWRIDLSTSPRPYAGWVDMVKKILIKQIPLPYNCRREKAALG